MKSGRAKIGIFQKMCIKNLRGSVSSDLKKKLDSFTLETSKNHLIRNFLSNGRLRVNGRKSHLNEAAVFVSFLAFFDVSLGRAIGIAHLVAFPARISTYNSSNCCSCCSRCSRRLGKEISLSLSFIILLGISVCGLSLKTKKNIFLKIG